VGLFLDDQGLDRLASPELVAILSVLWIFPRHAIPNDGELKRDGVVTL